MSVQTTSSVSTTQRVGTDAGDVTIYLRAAVQKVYIKGAETQFLLVTMEHKTKLGFMSSM